MTSEVVNVPQLTCDATLWTRAAKELNREVLEVKMKMWKRLGGRHNGNTVKNKSRMMREMMNWRRGS